MDVYLAPACALYGRGDGKYSCALWDPRRSDIYPAASASWWSAAEESALLNRTLDATRDWYFTGDSLSLQHMRAFACAVGAATFRAATPAEIWSTCFTPMQWEKWDPDVTELADGA